MSKIANWGRHTFEISSSRVYGFEELKIKAQRKTEDKEKKTSAYGKQTYTTKDASQPTEISMKTKLYAHLGVDPLSESKAWLEDAHAGKREYLYINGKKILGCTVRLVSAEVSEIEIGASGKWISCEVSLSFKQAGPWPKGSSTTGSSSGSSSKSTSKKKSTSSSKKSSSSKSGSKSGSNSSSKISGAGLDTGSVNGVKTAHATSKAANKKTSSVPAKLTYNKKTTGGKLSEKKNG